MKKIICTWDLTEAQKQRLEDSCPEAEITYLSDREVTAEILKNYEILVGNVAPAIVAEAKHLEWIQLNSAGAAQYCKPGILADTTMLTNGTGAYGMPLAEHMLGGLLALKKKLIPYYENQKQHLWRDEGAVSGIWNSTTLVLGTGNTGSEFAKRMQALGSRVIGLRRTLKEMPEGFDEQHQMDQLEALLPKADIVALCLPGTDATKHVITEKHLALMKDSAILLNVGRGNLVDCAALNTALRRGMIAGAFLDVTDPEPLPQDDPLWDAPGALITPHIAGGNHMKEIYETLVDITCENMRRYFAGEDLKNQVNRSVGY
ncbi:MAG: D-2-hydroxyacid dehydrogenase [Eubacteriales bacterium]|nr:D-2-hydroxyacid dehydrogenase [Eubacteriales bacterium]